MPLQNYAIENFRGLNLLEDEQEVGAIAATSLLNVDFDRHGRVRTRDGLSKFNSSTLATNSYLTIWPSKTVADGELVIQRADTNNIIVDKLSILGGVTNIGSWVANANNGIGHITSTTHFGTTSGSFLYMASIRTIATGELQLQKYNGTALSTGTGNPRFVAVSPRSNRLVQAYYSSAAASPSGANGSTSTVFFSDEGLPDTYTATNFVTLTPGDGEVITGMAVWGDLLFVFKQTKMFVFWGESVDDAGLVEFNYREVSLGGKIVTSQFTWPCVAGRDGVYISMHNGIYLTTGYRPEPISGPIEPLFTDAGSNYTSSDMRLDIPPDLTYAGGRLFATATVGAGGNWRTFVWHPDHKQWTFWKFPSNTSYGARQFVDWPTEMSAGAPPSSVAGGIYTTMTTYVGTASNNDVYELRTSNTTDYSSTAISWNYQSGYYALGVGEHYVRYIDLYGFGTVTAKMLSRGGRTGLTSDVGSAMTLGTSPTVARARRSSNMQGRLFAHYLSGTGRMQVNRIEQYYSSGSSV